MYNFNNNSVNNNNSCEPASNCEIINGNSLDIEVFEDDCEVKADIVVTSNHCIRLWGQAKDCDGNPIPNVLVKLLKLVTDVTGQSKYIGTAHTVSDCYGYYQFEILREEIGKFRVLFGKAAVGNEREVINTNCPVNCNDCTCKCRH